MRSEQRLREHICQKLGVTLTDEQWQNVLDRGHVDDFRSGEMTLDAVADEIGIMIRIWAQVTPSAPRLWSHAPEDWERVDEIEATRATALEELIAVEANRDPDVQTFRAEVLHGRSLHGNGVRKWLEKQAEADGMPVLWLTDVPVPRAEARVVSETLFQALERLANKPHTPPSDITVSVTVRGEDITKQADFRYLRCRLHSRQSETAVAEVMVAPHGILDRLRQLAQALAPRYGWDEPLAANFILTGVTPFIRHIAAQVDFASLPAATRITMRIDPTTTPDEVAKAYGWFRHQVVGSRYRALSEKHATLALFNATRPKGEPWAKRMAAWNAQHPQWAYTRNTNFARDCTQARRRLLWPRFERSFMLEVRRQLEAYDVTMIISGLRPHNDGTSASAPTDAKPRGLGTTPG